MSTEIETPAPEAAPAPKKPAAPKPPAAKKPAAPKAPKPPAPAPAPGQSRAQQVREILREVWAAGEHKKISTPSDFFIHPRVQRLVKAKQEHFIVAGLNGAHQVIRAFRSTVGIADRCQVHPREVFGPLVKMRAVACIVVHNHPSGELEPSPDDLAVTRRLLEAGDVLGIPVLDHLIVGRSGYTSLTERGLMPVRDII